MTRSETDSHRATYQDVLDAPPDKVAVMCGAQFLRLVITAQALSLTGLNEAATRPPVAMGKVRVISPLGESERPEEEAESGVRRL